MKHKLTSADIMIGAYIWYSGTTSVSSWDCPAVIHSVDLERQTFTVQSLDDMRVQTQEYTFEETPTSPPSRQSMRPASKMEVLHYLERRLIALTEFEVAHRQKLRQTLATKDEVQALIQKLED